MYQATFEVGSKRIRFLLSQKSNHMIPDEYGGEMTATLKRFYKERGRYRLHPENDYMDDIYVNKLEILGVAVKIISDVK